MPAFADWIRESTLLLVVVATIPLQMLLFIHVSYTTITWLREKPLDDPSPPRWVIPNREEVFGSNNGLLPGQKAIPNKGLIRRPHNAERRPLGQTGELLKARFEQGIYPFWNSPYVPPAWKKEPISTNLILDKSSTAPLLSGTTGHSVSTSDASKIDERTTHKGDLGRGATEPAHTTDKKDRIIKDLDTVKNDGMTSPVATVDDVEEKRETVGLDTRTTKIDGQKSGRTEEANSEGKTEDIRDVDKGMTTIDHKQTEEKEDETSPRLAVTPDNLGVDTTGVEMNTDESLDGISSTAFFDSNDDKEGEEQTRDDDRQTTVKRMTSETDEEGTSRQTEGMDTVTTDEGFDTTQLKIVVTTSGNGEGDTTILKSEDTRGLQTDSTTTRQMDTEPDYETSTQRTSTDSEQQRDSTTSDEREKEGEEVNTNDGSTHGTDNDNLLTTELDPSTTSSLESTIEETSTAALSYSSTNGVSQSTDASTFGSTGERVTLLEMNRETTEGGSMEVTMEAGEWTSEDTQETSAQTHTVSGDVGFSIKTDTTMPSSETPTTIGESSSHGSSSSLQTEAPSVGSSSMETSSSTVTSTITTKKPKIAGVFRLEDPQDTINHKIYEGEQIVDAEAFRSVKKVYLQAVARCRVELFPLEGGSPVSVDGGTAGAWKYFDVHGVMKTIGYC